MKHLEQKITIIFFTFLFVLTNQAIANPFTSCGESFFPDSLGIDKGFIKGDLLYLRAFQEGISDPWDAVLTIEDSHSPCSTTTKIGKGKSPHFKWDLGFRVGAGITLQDCDWNIAAFWTHFSPHRSKHCANIASWKVDYDTVDLLVGYKCQFNECFTLDAFGGLRSARINQHLHGNFVNRSIHEHHNSNSIFFLKRHDKQDFEGLGFLFGLVGKFDLGCGFTAYLEGDAGTIVGHRRQKSFIASGSKNCTKNVSTYKHRQKACPYYLESSIGILWEMCLGEGINLIVDLGYESHNYLNFGRIIETGNLYIHGGKFGLAIQF